MIAAAYVQPQSGIPVGRIVRRVLASKGVSQKHAAITSVGVQYEPVLSRGLSGLGPLDLHAVMCWPLPVIFKLFRVLLSAKLAQWETDSVQQEKRA